MAINVTVHEAQILTADAYTALQTQKTEVTAAHDEAAEILAQARAQAAAIIADAEANAAQLETDVEQIADTTLLRFMDTHAIDEAADAIRHTLREAQRLRYDFEAFTPWMREFVVNAVARMTQQLPPEEMWEGVLSQALMDIKDRWTLVLRCNPSYAPFFTSLVKNSPSLAGHITAVQVDRDRKEEEVHLVSASGVVDVSIPTQVDTVLRVFSEVAE